MTGHPLGLQLTSSGVRVTSAGPTTVIHVSSAHQWTDNRVHLREAATLAAAGFSVQLIAVEHPIEVDPTGVRVILLPTRRRLARLVGSSIQAIWVAWRSRAQIVHLHDPELAWGVPILRALGRKVVYDAHEDLPAQVAGKHYLSPRIRPVVVWVSRLIVKVASLANHVVVATERIGETFPSNKVTVIHNYPPLRASDESVAIEDRPAAVVYIGAMSTERGSEVMIDSFADQDFPPGWRAVVAGTASPESLLSELEANPGWAKVDFRGQVPPREARDILLAGRVGIVNFQPNEAHLDSLPTKMFEYLAAGLPVGASDFRLWRSIIEANECGMLVDPASPSAIAAAVHRYASDSDLLQRHSFNASRLARETLNWDSEGRKLVELYSGLS